MDRRNIIAIAAASGAAAGVVVGAVGAVVVYKRLSGASGSQLSSQQSNALQGAIGDGALVSNAELCNIIKELTNRMQTLEDAVRTKLLVRSGSSAYLTANESEGSDNEQAFREMDDDAESSGADDIFFTSRSSHKKPSSTTLAESKSIANAFKRLDKLLSGDNRAEQAEAFAELQTMKTSIPSCQSDANYMWRLTKATHQQAQAATEHENKKLIAFEAKDLAFKTLTLAGAEQLAAVHKWCAITIGNVGDFVSIQERVQNGSVFKKHIDEAIRLNDNDEMCHHLKGRWCYSVYMLSWVEKKVASAIMSMPSVSLDDALREFTRAEEISPGFWCENRLYLAKCYIANSDYTTAIEWLDKASQLPEKLGEQTVRAEIASMVAKYSSYRA